MPIDGRSAHAITRAAERYGLDLTVADLEALETEMSAGQLMILRRNNVGEIHGEVVAVARVQGQLCVIAFDPSCGRVKSFLPPTATRRPRWPRDIIAG